MTTCSKQFTLHVEALSGCPDWSQIVWPFSGNRPAIGTADSGYGIIDPMNGTGATLSMTAGRSGAQGAATAAQDGSVKFTGVVCNCNLHIELERVGEEDEFVGGSVEVSDTNHAYPNRLVLATFANKHGSFSLDFPFTTFDTLGAEHTLQISAIISVQDVYTFAPAHISIVCTLSNV